MISIDINNGGHITIHQDGHDKPLEVHSTNSGTQYISPGDFVTMLNWYNWQKRNGNEQLTF